MKKILVIDDDKDMRDMLGNLLESQKYRVITCADGAEGFVRAQDEKPDLIILDFLMPNVDGQTLVVDLQNSKEFKDTPIIVLSGKTDLKEKIEHLGVSGYFIKPFDMDEFMMSVKAILTDRIQYE